MAARASVASRWSSSVPLRWTPRSACRVAEDAERGDRAPHRPRFGVRRDGRCRRCPRTPISAACSAARDQAAGTSKLRSRSLPPRRSATRPRRRASSRRTLDEADFARQTAAAVLLLDVAVGRIDGRTGVAPVTSLSEPLVESVVIDTSLRRCRSGSRSPSSSPRPIRRPCGSCGARRTTRPLRPAQRLQLGLPPAAPVRAVVGRLRERRADQPHLLLVEPTGRALRRRPARKRRARLGDARHPPGLQRARRRRPAGPCSARSRPAATEVTVTTAGRRMSMPVEVVTGSLAGIPSNIRLTPIAPGTCGFPDFIASPRTESRRPRRRRRSRRRCRPLPCRSLRSRSQPTAPVPAPHTPHSPPRAGAGPGFAAGSGRTVPAGAARAAGDRSWRTRPRTTRSRPSPRRASPGPPAPPAPPSGLSVQTAPASQAQPFQAAQVQEQRRLEQAFEVDSAAVAYAHPPSPLPWELLGRRRGAGAGDRGWIAGGPRPPARARPGLRRGLGARRG